MSSTVDINISSLFVNHRISYKPFSNIFGDSDVSDYVFYSIHAAYVRPWDLYLHPGESFIANCTLHEEYVGDVNVSSLYFKHYPSDGDPRVATTAHQVVGNNIMQIHLTNVKMSDAGFYRCYSGNDELIAASSCHVQIGGKTDVVP